MEKYRDMDSENESKETSNDYEEINYFQNDNKTKKSTINYEKASHRSTLE